MNNLFGRKEITQTTSKNEVGRRQPDSYVNGLSARDRLIFNNTSITSQGIGVTNNQHPYQVPRKHKTAVPFYSPSFQPQSAQSYTSTRTQRTCSVRTDSATSSPQPYIPYSISSDPLIPLSRSIHPVPSKQNKSLTFSQAIKLCVIESPSMGNRKIFSSYFDYKKETTNKNAHSTEIKGKWINSDDEDVVTTILSFGLRHPKHVKNVVHWYNYQSPFHFDLSDIGNQLSNDDLINKFSKNKFSIKGEISFQNIILQRLSATCIWSSEQFAMCYCDDTMIRSTIKVLRVDGNIISTVNEVFLGVRVSALCAHPNQHNLFAAGGSDGSITVFNIETESIVKHIPGNASLSSMHQIGNYFGVSYFDGLLKLYDWEANNSEAVHSINNYNCFDNRFGLMCGLEANKCILTVGYDCFSIWRYDNQSNQVETYSMLNRFLSVDPVMTQDHILTYMTTTALVQQFIYRGTFRSVVLPEVIHSNVLAITVLSQMPNIVLLACHNGSIVVIDMISCGVIGTTIIKEFVPISYVYEFESSCGGIIAFTANSVTILENELSKSIGAAISTLVSPALTSKLLKSNNTTLSCDDTFKFDLCQRIDSYLKCIYDIFYTVFVTYESCLSVDQKTFFSYKLGHYQESIQLLIDQYTCLTMGLVSKLPKMGLLDMDVSSRIFQVMKRHKLSKLVPIGKQSSSREDFLTKLEGKLRKVTSFRHYATNKITCCSLSQHLIIWSYYDEMLKYSNLFVASVHNDTVLLLKEIRWGGNVTALCSNPLDSYIFAAGFADGMIVIFNINTDCIVQSMPGSLFESSVTSFCVLGIRFAAGYSDGTIKVWEWEGLNLDALYSISTQLEGNINVFPLFSNNGIVGVGNKQFYVWKFGDDSGTHTNMDYIVSGTPVVSNGSILTYVSTDNRIVRYDIEYNGKSIMCASHIFITKITSICILNRMTNIIVIALDDGQIQLFDFIHQRCIKSITIDHTVYCLDIFSIMDNQLISISNNEIIIWHNEFQSLLNYIEKDIEYIVLPLLIWWSDPSQRSIEQSNCLRSCWELSLQEYNSLISNITKLYCNEIVDSRSLLSIGQQYDRLYNKIDGIYYFLKQLKYNRFIQFIDNGCILDTHNNNNNNDGPNRQRYLIKTFPTQFICIESIYNNNNIHKIETIRYIANSIMVFNYEGLTPDSINDVYTIVQTILPSQSVCELESATRLVIEFPLDDATISNGQYFDTFDKLIMTLIDDKRFSCCKNMLIPCATPYVSSEPIANRSKLSLSNWFSEEPNGFNMTNYIHTNMIQSGNPIDVVVMDSGLDLNTPLIPKTLINTPIAFDCIDDLKGIECFDDAGHGTEVSALMISNHYGIINGHDDLIKLHVYRCASSFGFIHKPPDYLTLSIARCFEDILKVISPNQFLVINLSLDCGAITNPDVAMAMFGGFASELQNNEERRKNTILVLSAGNVSIQNNECPKNLDDRQLFILQSVFDCCFETNVVIVAASDKDAHICPFSNAGHKSVTLRAPGCELITPTRNNQIALVNGTSYASPVAAVTLALQKRLNDSFTIEELFNSINRGNGSRLLRFPFRRYGISLSDKVTSIDNELSLEHLSQQFASDTDGSVDEDWYGHETEYLYEDETPMDSVEEGANLLMRLNMQEVHWNPLAIMLQKKLETATLDAPSNWNLGSTSSSTMIMGWTPSISSIEEGLSPSPTEHAISRTEIVHVSKKRTPSWEVSFHQTYKKK